MIVKSYSIKQIQQVDNYSFSIIWSDGELQKFNLSNLQKNCSCAGCKDENTGNRIIDPSSIPDNLKAKSIQNVGRYGLKIQFISGCCKGIYSFQMLRNLKEIT